MYLKYARNVKWVKEINQKEKMIYLNSFFRIVFISYFKMPKYCLLHQNSQQGCYAVWKKEHGFKVNSTLNKVISFHFNS